jgi:uncharacterized membrane protein
MNTFLWIIQGVLAFIFLMVGVMKLLQPKEKAREKMGYVDDFTQQQLYGIGILEILGALGLILPLATGILPILTPLAAVGLAVTMVAAFLTHLRRGEVIPLGIMNILLFVMAALVAIFRF